MVCHCLSPRQDPGIPWQYPFQILTSQGQPWLTSRIREGQASPNKLTKNKTQPQDETIPNNIPTSMEHFAHCGRARASCGHCKGIPSLNIPLKK